MNELTIQSRIQGMQGMDLMKKQQVEKTGDSPAFGQVLKSAINEVNDLQADADKSIKGLQLGEDIDIHEAMIALNKMDASFKLLMEVRNKLMKAYEEVMRMQV